MAGSFAYQKQLVDGEFQPLGVYTVTVDANYAAPADASLIRINVPAQTLDRFIDFSALPAGQVVQIEVIDSNGQAWGDTFNIGGTFSLNDTDHNTAVIHTTDAAGSIILFNGTAAQYDVGTSGTTVPLLNTANLWSAEQGLTDASQLRFGTNALNTKLGFVNVDFIGVYGPFGNLGIALSHLGVIDLSAGGSITGGGQDALMISTAGKVTIGPAASGTPLDSYRTGLATMAAGTIAVADTALTAGSTIQLTFGFAPLGIISYAKNPGVGFTINSTNAGDAGEISYTRCVL